MGIKLYLQVYLFRVLQQINSYLDRYVTSPKVLSHTFTVSIPSELSKHPGNITLYFYTPPGYKRPEGGTPLKKEYPLIINFYGGGFTIGHAHDDARWATALLKDVNVIFVSVNYRRAPRYPQPTAVGDSVDALRWLWAHADEYGIDRARTVLTGFSAGGNLTLATPLRHYAERQNEDSNASSRDGKVSGVIAFYPVVNMTIPRQAKYDSNPIAKEKGSLPLWAYLMFDASYHKRSSHESRGTINLSPALAPSDLLKNALPQKIAMYSCEYDVLLVETEHFRKELKALGKTVGGYMVSSVPHGFDKPVFSPNKKERNEMYQDAVEQIKSMV
jgi:putative ergosteryl-3beta-O-L-aspartate hydrolase